jgi:hypothetical protein
LMQTIDPAMFD